MPFISSETAYELELGHAMRSFYYAQAYGQLIPEARVETTRIGKGVMVYAGPGSPINRAIAFGFSGEDPDPLIDQAEQFFQRHNEPPSFDVCPLADRAFVKALNGRGYRLEKFFSIMACSLPYEIDPIPYPAAIEVQRVSPEQADLGLYTTAQGYEETDLPAKQELEMVAPNFHSRNAECYLAWIGGQPAGGGAMYAYQGVVELGGDSTRPAYRRRGVQTALLLQRLEEAQEAGNELAMAMTKAGSDSQRNMERVGFRLAYTKAVLVRREMN